MAHGENSVARPAAQIARFKNRADVEVGTLEQNASAVIALVVASETVAITDHGRPVAQLTATPESQLQRLVDSGRARPPRRDINSLPPPAQALASPINYRR